MSDSLYRLQRRILEDRSLGLVLSLGASTILLALGFYAYLGTFSRYGSDDYCLSAFFRQENLLSAMVLRYFNASSRYTNILFIGLADTILGWYNVAILPALMLSLFVLGLYLLLKEINEMAQWGWSRLLIFFVSLLIAYFSITQAPDLYETLYWRAGMTSHFAPVVFMPFFGAFLLRQIRKARNRLIDHGSGSCKFHSHAYGSSGPGGIDVPDHLLPARFHPGYISHTSDPNVDFHSRASRPVLCKIFSTIPG
jgi:hypothetical protein